MIDRLRLPSAQKEVRPQRQNKLVGLPLISSPSWDWSPPARGGSELERALKGASDPLSLRPSPAGQCGFMTLGNHILSLSPGCNLLGSLADHMMMDPQSFSVVSVALQIGRWLLGRPHPRRKAPLSAVQSQLKERSSQVPAGFSDAPPALEVPQVQPSNLSSEASNSF